MIPEPVLKYLIGILYFLLAISILVFIHEFGHFIVAVRAGIRVEVFSLGFGKRLFSRKRKDTEFCVSAIPLGGYVKLAGDNLEEFHKKPDEFLAQPILKRFLVIAAGPVMNYFLGIVLFSTVFFLGFPYQGTRVGSVMKDMGAMEAGIQAGDRIIAVEGKPVKVWDELNRSIKAAGDKESVTLTVVRDNQERVFTVRMKQQTGFDVLKQKKKMGFVGIRPDPNDVTRIRYGFFESCKLGFKRSIELTVLTYKAFGYIISRKLPVSESVSGPIGILDLFLNIKTLIDFLLLTAIISLSLAIFNLLPLPALDGGHIFLLAVEKVRGKYLSKSAEDIVGKIGLGFLIALAVCVTYNDLARKGILPKVSDLAVKPAGMNPGSNVSDGTLDKTKK